MMLRPETLEEFIEAHMRAALYAYNSPQLRPLLRGEETVGGATALLLEENLRRRLERPVSETAKAARQRKARALRRERTGKDRK